MKKNLIKIIISILLIIATLLISFYVKPINIFMEHLQSEYDEKHINDITSKHKLIYLGNFETDEEDVNENKDSIKDFISSTNISEYIEYKYENLNITENFIFYNSLINFFPTTVTQNRFILMNRTGEIVHVFKENADVEEIKTFLKDYFAKFV